MKRWTTTASAALLATMAQPALAGDLLVQPVPVGLEVARFDRGVPTLDLQGRGGAVQVTPLGLDRGNLVFGVAVYNDGVLPADFAESNIRVTSGGLPVRVLSTADLVSKARSRAIWRSVAVGLISGVAAGIASSRRDTYTTKGKAGDTRFRSVTTGPSLAGRLQAQQFALAGGAGVIAIQAQLDAARAAIGDETVQRTTVRPADSYAGKIVLERIKPGALPQRVDLSIDWNGDRYPFSFQLARKGTAAPVFAARTAIPVQLRVASAVTTVALSTPSPARPMPIIASMAVVSPAAIPARPALAAYVPPAPDAYARALADEQGVRGGNAAEGWTISD